MRLTGGSHVYGRKHHRQGQMSPERHVVRHLPHTDAAYRPRPACSCRIPLSVKSERSLLLNEPLKRTCSGLTEQSAALPLGPSHERRNAQACHTLSTLCPHLLSPLFMWPQYWVSCIQAAVLLGHTDMGACLAALASSMERATEPGFTCGGCGG